jgi:FlaA1/EpsC-like NDP-sugar epimerase
MFMKQRAWAVGVLQVGIIAASLYAAWALRFDFKLPHHELILQALPILVLARLIAFARFNLFHGYWRYTGMNDAVDVAKAVAASSAGFFVVERYVVGNIHFPLSVYLIEAVLALLLLGGVRVVSRTMVESVVRAAQKHAKRVVVVGAGFAGQLLVRELMLADSGFCPVCYVDDDPKKKGGKIHGLPIVGTVDQLREVAQQFGASEVLIAIPTPSSCSAPFQACASWPRATWMLLRSGR